MKFRDAEPLSPSVTLGALIASDGSPSSSISVRLAPVTRPIPCALLAEPVTVTLRFPSSAALSTAVMAALSTAVMAAVSEGLAVLPAAMVIVASRPTASEPTS